jgi:peptidoglycan hydrolase CwlO-like protein
MFFLKRIIIFPLLFALTIFPIFPIFASQCNEGDPRLDAICRELEEWQKRLNDLKNALAGAEESLSGLESRLQGIQSDLASTEEKLSQLEAEIIDRENHLGQQKKLLAARVRSFYKKSQQLSPLFLLLSSQNIGSFTRELSYRLSAANEDKRIILSVSKELADLEENKASVEKNKEFLAFVKKEVDQQTASLREEIKGARIFEKEIQQEIARLTAEQQRILAARAGTFTTSVGEVPISNIPCSGPPGSPSFCDPGGGVWFAAFSFGAWTHRKGMSQYGAQGRAKAGQNTNEILQHYYGRTPVNKDTSGTILVDGFGALDFENYYLMGIAEMPSSWHPEALRAQAIAARSYAYRYKIANRSICATQSCQVFSLSKATNPPSAWREAVEATRGQVLEEVTAFYSSTAGGYLTTSGWDTTDNQGGPGFATRAWESQAGSPWFYASWFTQNYTSNSAKCGRSHPWLTVEELADILNAWQVIKNEGSDERILPITINQCPIGGSGGNSYSMEELKNKAESSGGAFTQVSSASVAYANNGETSSISFETDRGSVTISGAEFKQAFNLRAPGYIAIRSPLFNVEKK